jgi:hypothetical protein
VSGAVSPRSAVRSARVRAALAAALAAAAASRPASAQRAGTAPPAARALVARVDSRFGDDEADVGAAVVVGADAGALYLATARHVVRKGEQRATRVRVTFAGPNADTATAVVLPDGDPRLDLAALRVPRPRAAAAAALAALDRLGDVRALAFGDPVVPVGCPQGECWNVPVPPDRVVGVDRQGVIFQSSFVSPGSSGGALFDGLWELVGLVTEDAPPRANALPMDQVLAQLRAWRVPVQLRRRAIPRAGYRTVVGAALLAPLGRPDNGPDLAGRWPSGRVALTRRTRSRLTLHAAALRLAPANLGVTAGMAGASVHLGAGRFSLQPFAEAGLGSVEARYDGGGFALADGRYVPSWQRQRADGLGAGAGLDAQVVVAPRVVVGLLAGSWRFATPEAPAEALSAARAAGTTIRMPGLPNLFLGAGLRWGL